MVIIAAMGDVDSTLRYLSFWTNGFNILIHCTQSSEGVSGKMEVRNETERFRY